MCGIAGFIGNDQWKETADLSWLDGIVERFEEASASENWQDLEAPVKDLTGRFDDLMSFGMHAELLRCGDIRLKTERLADTLKIVSLKISDLMSGQSRTDRLEQLLENVRDCLWQITEEDTRKRGTNHQDYA